MANLDQPTCIDGIITTPDSNYHPDPRGAGYEIFTHLKKHSAKKLVIDGYTGEEETFGSALQKSIRVALKMRELGIKPNDLIVMCTPNSVHSPIPIFAALYLGAKITCFDPQMHVNEAVILMKQIEPEMLFVSLESVDFMKEVLRLSNKTVMMVVFGETSTHLNYFEMLNPCNDEEEFLPVEVEETQVAFIFFSSGTSGMPKGVCLTHRAYLGQVGVALDLDEPFDLILIYSNLYWSVNVMYWGCSIIKGYCRLSMNFVGDMHSIWDAIATYKPNFIFLSPYRMRQFCEAKSSLARVDGLKKIYICGGPLFNNELENFRKMFPDTVVVSGYGMTEVGLGFYFPSSTAKDLKFIEDKPTSVGLVLNGISYKVVNVDTEELLGPYEKGELRVKTKSMLSEYYKIESSDAFDKDGWFKTGDLVYYDEDYYFYHVERIKELIKYRGWHVPPRMIENVLMQRDDVSAACVIGIPNEVDDEHPMAIVVLSSGSHPVHKIEEEICRYVEEALGNSFKLRGGVKIVDAIPFGPTGKFDVKQLKSEILNSI